MDTPHPSSWVGIDHVQLAIPLGAEEVARAFWTGLLGFAELPKRCHVFDPFGNRIELVEVSR